MNIIRFLGRGVYHEDNSVPCQDRAKYRYAINRNVILALSDGCSSAAYAETAAEVNVDTVIRIFSGCTLAEFLREKKDAADLIDPILEAMKKQAPKQFEKDPSDFSATLLFAVTDGSDVLLGHIGDGNILCIGEDGIPVFFSEEENIGAANRTYFTVSDNAKAHLRLNLIPANQVRNILLYSDGPQKMLWYRGDKNIANAAADLAAKVRDGSISNCTQLADTLTEMTSDAMYQLMDDWSMLILDTKQNQCRDLTFDPISMKQNFMKHFSPQSDKEKEA